MQSFDFFGLVLGESLLHNIDNLSRTLQKDLSAAEGQLTMERTKRTLMSIWSDNSFDLFWEKVNSMASDLDVSDPVLPQRSTNKLWRGWPPEYPSTPKDNAESPKCLQSAGESLHNTLTAWKDEKSPSYIKHLVDSKWLNTYITFCSF